MLNTAAADMGLITKFGPGCFSRRAASLRPRAVIGESSCCLLCRGRRRRRRRSEEKTARPRVILAVVEVKPVQYCM
jgi:hypothetical protein